jgi:hypothetical protein
MTTAISDPAFKPGLEGVVAFETTIAEPDREGGALRYRGVDVEELVGRHPFEQVRRDDRGVHVDAGEVDGRSGCGRRQLGRGRWSVLGPPGVVPAGA